jgi:hypothetical protein
MNLQATNPSQKPVHELAKQDRVETTLLVLFWRSVKISAAASAAFRFFRSWKLPYESNLLVANCTVIPHHIILDTNWLTN